MGLSIKLKVGLGLATLDFRGHSLPNLICLRRLDLTNIRNCLIAGLSLPYLRSRGNPVSLLSCILFLPVVMRPTFAKLAAQAGRKGLKPAPMALLPPIPLYRRLFRAHRRHLPSEMRLLGDEYIKAEFRAHRSVDNPAHLVSWTAALPTPIWPFANLAPCRLASSQSGSFTRKRLKATSGRVTRLRKGSFRR